MTRVVILLAILSALSGRAAAQCADPAELVLLRAENTQLGERVAMLQKERDTLNSQKSIIDRDKAQLEKMYQDLQARCGAVGSKPK